MKLEIQEYRKDRTVYLNDEIDSGIVADIICDIQDIIDNDYHIFEQNKQQFQALGDKYVKVYTETNEYPTITININSPGGDIYSGLGLYDFIHNINTNTDHHISIICNGMVASMATIILLASDDRKATKHTSFLIHSLSDLTFGKMQDIEDNLIECRRLNEMLSDIYLEHTKLTKTKLKEVDKSKKDWWFGVDKALELGLIKEII